MPKVYTVQLDGKTYDLEGGDTPPTEADVRAAVASMPHTEAKPMSWGGLGSAVLSGAGTALKTLGSDVAGMAGMALHPLETAKGLAAMPAAIAEGVRTIAAHPTASAGALASYVAEHPAEMVGHAAGFFVPGAAAKGVGGALRTVSPKVMDAGLWRSAAQRMDFPGTPQRLVDEGIIPTPTRVQNAIRTTEHSVDAMAQQQAGPASRRVLPSRMADQAEQFAIREGRIPGLGDMPGPEVADLQQVKNQYLAQNTRARDLPETIAQKRAYQARTSYSARPNAPTQTNESVNFNKGIAAANREAAIRMEPRLEGELAKEQDLIGALDAVTRTDAKGTPLVANGLVRKMILRQEPMGAAAIGLDRMGRAASSPWTTQALRAALLAQMTGDQ